MRTHYWLIVVLLIGAAGVALGYAVAPGADAGPEIGVPEETRSSAPDSQVEERDNGGRTEVRNSPRETKREAEDARATPTAPVKREAFESDGELLAVLKKVAPARDLSGDRVLRGEVRDLAGEPIAEAEVSLIYSPDGGWGRTPRVYSGHGRELWESMEEDVKRFVGIRRAMYGGNRKATTDADGVFEIRGLADARYSCMVEHDDYDGFRSYDSKYRYRPGDEPVYIGKRVYPVHIRMGQADGETPPPGYLSVRRMGVGTARISNREIGTEWEVRLQEGVYSASVKFRDPQGATESVVFAVEAGMVTPDVVIPYAPSWTLGVVVDAGELVNTNLDVYCVPDDPDRDPEELLRNLDRYTSKRSRLQGDRASFANLEAGSYVVGVRHAGDVLVWKRIEWTGSGDEVNLTVEAPTLRECIVCEVEVAKGLLSRPRFTIKQDRNRFNLLAWEASDGKYLLRLPTDSRFDVNAEAELTVRDSDIGEQSTALRHSGPQSVSFVFSETGYLLVEWDEGHVTRTRTYVQLFDRAGESVAQVHYRHRNSAPNGVVVKTIPPGRYRMKVFVGGHPRWPIHTSDVDIAVGLNRQSISVPELTTVSLTVEKENVGHATLVAELHGEKVEQHISIRRDRPTTIANLPPGFYTLRYRARQEKENTELTFTLPGTEEVVIR